MSLDKRFMKKKNRKYSKRLVKEMDNPKVFLWKIPIHD